MTKAIEINSRCVQRFLVVYNGKGMTPVCCKIASRLIRPSREMGVPQRSLREVFFPYILLIRFLGDTLDTLNLGTKNLGSMTKAFRDPLALRGAYLHISEYMTIIILADRRTTNHDLWVSTWGMRFLLWELDHKSGDDEPSLLPCWLWARQQFSESWVHLGPYLKGVISDFLSSANCFVQLLGFL